MRPRNSLAVGGHSFDDMYRGAAGRAGPSPPRQPRRPQQAPARRQRPAGQGGAGAGRRRSLRSSGRSADPAVIARGKTLFEINCRLCHGADLRGGDMGGVNLLRSNLVLTDQHGELILPVVKGGRTESRHAA